MKKYSMWLTELIIWGIIIFSAIFLSLYVYSKDTKDKYTYYVFFNDVDGLIKGSPVKIQGYQVGHVSNISLVNDEVFITFIITEKDIKMPEKIAATIAFTGMGGSKSLELFVPPKDSKVNNYITTIEPRRLQDFYVYQNQIANTIVVMTTQFMELADEKRVNLLKNFIKEPTMLNDMHNTLDTVQKTEQSFIDQRRKNDTANKK